MNPLVQHFFDENSNTFSYVVTDPITRQCAKSASGQWRGGV